MASSLQSSVRTSTSPLLWSTGVSGPSIPRNSAKSYIFAWYFTVPFFAHFAFCHLLKSHMFRACTSFQFAPLTTEFWHMPNVPGSQKRSWHGATILCPCDRKGITRVVRWGWSRIRWGRDWWSASPSSAVITGDSIRDRGYHHQFAHSTDRGERGRHNLERIALHCS